MLKPKLTGLSSGLSAADQAAVRGDLGLAVSASGLAVSVPAFSLADGFAFDGGLLDVVASGIWYVGVDLFSGELIALPRLGHRGWVPVAKVVASDTGVASIEQIGRIRDLPPS